MGLRKQFINSFMFPTLACAGGFNNNNNNELLKSIDSIGEIYNGIFMRSVNLFFCIRIRLTISSLSEGGGQKRSFSTGAPGKFNGEIF